MLIKVGAVAIFAGVAGNVYFLLRYREVFNELARSEGTYQQQGVVLSAQNQAAQALLRDFMGHAKSDPQLAQIIQRYQAANTAPRKPAK